MLEIQSTIDLQGCSLETDALPPRLSLCTDEGVVAADGLDVRCLHRWKPPFDASIAPRVVKAPSGDLLVFFSAGKGHMWHRDQYEDGKTNSLVIYRSSDKGETWRGPFLPFMVPYGHNSSVPLVPRESKRIYLFSTEVNPEWGGWPDGGVAMRVSDDDGWTWSEPRHIVPVNGPDYRGQTHMQITETEKGTWLLGSYRTKRLAGPEGREDRQYLLRSTDKGESWTLLPDEGPKGWYVPEYNYMIEGRPLALGGEEVLFWGRAPGGYSYELRSQDDGETWSGPEPVPLVHPDAPPMVWACRDGETLFSLIHNRYDPANPKHGHEQRTELWFSLSPDRGRTWSAPRFLLANAVEPAGCLNSPMVSYCDFLADGDDLHLFVDWQCRQILHVRSEFGELDRFPMNPLV